MNVSMGEVQCKDYSQFVATYPLTSGLFGNDPSRVPTVHFDMQASQASPSTPYTITVNGQDRVTGSISSGGRLATDVVLTNNQPSRVMLHTGYRTMVDRTITPRC
jgi:hypothetical protein